MESLSSVMDSVYCNEDESIINGRPGRGNHKRDKTTEFKSKNLEAERNRRQKLDGRLMALRTVVPIITNMKKATIIDDAITYVKGLQKKAKGLSDELHEMESVSEEGGEKPVSEDDDTTYEDMEKCKIEAEVDVSHIDGNKLWIKIIHESKRGEFTKLMEAMSFLGFEVTNTNVTTYKDVTLTILCVEETCVEMVAAEQVREFLLEMIGGVYKNDMCF